MICNRSMHCLTVGDEPRHTPLLYTNVCTRCPVVGEMMLWNLGSSCDACSFTSCGNTAMASGRAPSRQPLITAAHDTAARALEVRGSIDADIACNTACAYRAQR
jgi:hypothetical protein